MTIYNRYIEAQPCSSDEDQALVASAQAVWQCGYLINSWVFPDKAGTKPIHPLGLSEGWTESDADLSSAAVISLSAASKTARSLAWNFSRNRDVGASGPLGFVQGTSEPSALASFPQSPLSKVRNLSYSDLVQPDTLRWIGDLSPSRIVILDFGAATTALQGLVKSLSESLSQLTVTTIWIGTESKVYTSEELQAAAACREQLKKIQLNTSALRDRAIEARDAAQWFKGMNDAWNRCIKESGMGNIKMLWRKGVEGRDGIEGMWQDVCEGKLRGDQCMVVQLQKD
jgi:hypothetical protein